jgi:hypothetical protein
MIAWLNIAVGLLGGFARCVEVVGLWFDWRRGTVGVLRLRRVVVRGAGDHKVGAG